MASAIFMSVSSEGIVCPFSTREVAAQQSRTAFDIALGQAAIAAVRTNHFPDVYLRFFFRHCLVPNRMRILRTVLGRRKKIIY